MRNEPQHFTSKIELEIFITIIKHLLEPAKPVTWPTTVGSDNQNLDVGTNLPVENVVGKAWDATTPNIGRELDPFSAVEPHKP